MKKRISAMLVALLLAVAVCIPALASDGIMNYVIDAEDMLHYEDWDGLEDLAADISHRHACGVYIYFTENYIYYGDGTPYDVAKLLYEYPTAPLGEGEGMEGILLLMSLDERDWVLYVHGEKAERVFDSDVQAAIADEFLPWFTDDNWDGGFHAYLYACDEYLTLAEQEEPVQEEPTQEEPVQEAPAQEEPTQEEPAQEENAQEEPVQDDTASAVSVKSILTVIGISCIIALLICLALKGKMKSVQRKSEARKYTTDGLHLTEEYDRYTHTTETVRHIENNSDGGGSGSSNSGKKF